MRRAECNQRRDPNEREQHIVSGSHAAHVVGDDRARGNGKWRQCGLARVALLRESSISSRRGLCLTQRGGEPLALIRVERVPPRLKRLTSLD